VYIKFTLVILEWNTEFQNVIKTPDDLFDPFEGRNRLHDIRRRISIHLLNFMKLEGRLMYFIDMIRQVYLLGNGHLFVTISDWINGLKGEQSRSVSGKGSLFETFTKLGR
jgi:hypothetical protein